MKTTYFTIWIGRGDPKIYSKCIDSFLNDKNVDELYIFVDSQFKLIPEIAAEVDAYMDKFKKDKRVSIIDIQDCPSIKSHAYYNWVIHNTEPKHLAAASDCLRFLIADYLLQTTKAKGIYFFEADVELKKPLNAVKFAFIKANEEGKIIIIDKNAFETMYIPAKESSQDAVQAVCMTYANIAEFILNKNLILPITEWKNLNTVDDRVARFLCSLLYFKGWTSSNVINDLSPELLCKEEPSKETTNVTVEDLDLQFFDNLTSENTLNEQLVNLFGIQLPFQVIAFREHTILEKDIIGDSYIEHNCYTKDTLWVLPEKYELPPEKVESPLTKKQKQETTNPVSDLFCQQIMSLRATDIVGVFGSEPNSNPLHSGEDESDLSSTQKRKRTDFGM